MSGTALALGGRIETQQRQREARVLRRHRRVTVQGDAVVLQRPLPFKGKLQGAGLQGGPAGQFFARHAGKLHRQRSFGAGCRGELVLRQVGKEENEQGLRLLAGDAAPDIDLRIGKLGGRAM
ncbi:hypothetical protein, partial [Methyloceanibacter marginalis]|uniref:hypothetical protein n=1 Tax=Methyloceanibacter marginalis TaxID=1774971 RepID=UPI00195B1004